MITDYHHLSPSQTGGRGRGPEEKVKSCGGGKGALPGSRGHTRTSLGSDVPFVVSVTLKSLLLAQNIAAPPGFTERGDADIFHQSVKDHFTFNRT